VLRSIMSLICSISRLNHHTFAGSNKRRNGVSPFARRCACGGFVG
jgi:uncharacterized 2Fe-2S/4Fe-4S cluster protein (DUF4445 family)